MELKKLERDLSGFLFWVILVAGLLLPWCVGIWVKLTLQAQGRPTWPWMYFLNPGALSFELLATISWALPFTGLAFLCRYGLEKKLPLFELSVNQRLVCIIFSVGIGIFSAVPFFRDLFLQFDPVVFLCPWLFMKNYGRDMGLALLVGRLVLGAKNKFLPSG